MTIQLFIGILLGIFMGGAGAYVYFSVTGQLKPKQ